MTRDYRSQFGQDRYVVENVFKEMRGGFFVDVGAGDGDILSNTWVFEKDFGWSGICIEPHPETFPTLQHKRACQTYQKIVYDYNGEVDYHQVKDNIASLAYFSSLTTPIQYNEMEVVKAQCETLETILGKLNCPQVINYLSIDTEGSECAIFKKFFEESKRVIQCISVECNTEASAKNLRDILIPVGYTCVETVGIDGIYVHKDLKL